MEYVALAVIISYMIGSIPLGYILARYRGVDITKHGSGNIGATNVWRTLGPVPGILVLAGDALKGIAAVYIGRQTGVEGVELLAGMAALVGHSWSLYLKFKGGKIIATGAGVLLALWPITFLIAVGVFLGTLAISRYVSLSSMMAAISVPLVFYFTGADTFYFIFGIFVCLFAIYKHTPNIKKIIQGTEFKVGEKK